MGRKQLLIEKALELFAKQGFEATSVQQITEHCGISKGAFYLSFKSKDELITAIIDYFMMQIISDIDYTVRTCETNEDMLYEFYYTTLHSFSKHSGFAKIFVKEQALPINEELILKLNDFDTRINQTILSMLQKLYNDEVKGTIYDLLICIKGFIRNCAELSFHYNVNMDANLDLFVKSLVEKTNILARHVSIPLVSKEMFQMFEKPGDHSVIQEHERIIALIEQEIHEIEDPIEMESLKILKDTLSSTNPSIAIIKGLLENLRNNVQCKWISYLIREYYQL